MRHADVLISLSLSRWYRTHTPRTHLGHTSDTPLTHLGVAREAAARADRVADADEHPVEPHGGRGAHREADQPADGGAVRPAAQLRGVARAERGALEVDELEQHLGKCITLHYITLYYSPVQYTTLKLMSSSSTLESALHYITLHYITVQYSTLH